MEHDGSDAEQQTTHRSGARRVGFCSETETSFRHAPQETPTVRHSQSRLSPRHYCPKVKTPKPVSPRRNMNDVLFGPSSPTRCPEQASPRIAPRDARIGNFTRERGCPQASSACVRWLKQCQQDANAEDRVEEMMTGNT